MTGLCPARRYEAMTTTTENDPAEKTAIAHPTFREVFICFAMIGLLSFGGPAGQIALMHRILVEQKRWISEERFLHALNYCMLLPGPEAQQLAIYAGWLLHGVRGGIAAGVLFVLPGFFVILTLSIVYTLSQGTTLLDAVFFGLKAAVLAVVIEAVVRVGKRALKTRFMIGLAAVALVAIFAFGVPFPLIVLAAGVIGYVAARWQPQLLAPIDHGGRTDESGPYLQLREPATGNTAGRALRVIATCGALWIAPVLLLAAIFGWHSIFTPIAGFFSVVTFGGAYAVLAYVAQKTVAGLGWLRPGEMLDGLAMAETTPGPLILVLVFVGFIAAFRMPPGIDPLSSAVVGAALTTWVTFVPCFLWIALGSPHIERLRRNKALAGALSAITAAVVGVILNLAIWFGLHVMFRQVGTLDIGPLAMAWPELASIDLAAAGLAVASAIALLYFKIGMIPTLAGAAILGAALRLAL